MVSNLLGLAAAQLLPKPGARDMLARLVTVDDLPAGRWTVLDQRTWRTGVAGPATGWGRRARAQRSVTAWRSFAGTGPRRWCWVQICPLASDSDARRALEAAGDRGVRNPRFAESVTHENDEEPSVFPGVDRLLLNEAHTTGPDGDTIAKTLSAAAGTYVIVVCATGEAPWPADSVTEVLHRQLDRLTQGA